jgi:hypothetical protein
MLQAETLIPVSAVREASGEASALPRPLSSANLDLLSECGRAGRYRTGPGRRLQRMAVDIKAIRLAQGFRPFGGSD